MKQADKPFTKLTANIATDDMDFIKQLITKKKYASNTDAIRDAIRDFRKKMEAQLQSHLKIHHDSNSSS